MGSSRGYRKLLRYLQKTDVPLRIEQTPTGALWTLGHLG